MYAYTHVYIHTCVSIVSAAILAKGVKAPLTHLHPTSPPGVVWLCLNVEGCFMFYLNFMLSILFKLCYPIFYVIYFIFFVVIVLGV